MGRAGGSKANIFMVTPFPSLFTVQILGYSVPLPLSPVPVGGHTWWEVLWGSRSLSVSPSQWGSEMQQGQCPVVLGVTWVMLTGLEDIWGSNQDQLKQSRNPNHCTLSLAPRVWILSDFLSPPVCISSILSTQEWSEAQGLFSTEKPFS